MTMKITKDPRPNDIDILKPYGKYLMYKCIPKDKPAVEMTYAEMNEDQPTWNVESMIKGTERLIELAKQEKLLYDVYSQEEWSDDPEKADVKLIYMPARVQPSDKPFIVAVSGGAYTCVCSLVESIPSAVHFNELGYNVFVFNYRCMRDPLFPKPAEDLAAAIRYILANKTKFNITNEEYIVNGFSAGASLTTIWGAEATGYAKYGLPKPKALFTIYPFISFDSMSDEGAKDWFRKIMFGSTADAKAAATYDIPGNFTANYPPCFITHAKDDPVVPVRNSEWLKELLDQYSIPARLELIETGGHGWGDGSGTDAQGWPERAIAFVETL